MQNTAQVEMMTAATYLGELMIVSTKRMHCPDVTSLCGAGDKMSAKDHSVLARHSTRWIGSVDQSRDK